MKETFIKDFVLYESENVNEFEDFPFDKELLVLLKRENPFPQMTAPWKELQNILLTGI